LEVRKSIVGKVFCHPSRETILCNFKLRNLGCSAIYHYSSVMHAQ
jgi:hypothetical protein